MAKKWSDKFSTIYESKVKLEDAFEWRIALEENKESIINTKTHGPFLS